MIRLCASAILAGILFEGSAVTVLVTPLVSGAETVRVGSQEGDTLLEFLAVTQGVVPNREVWFVIDEPLPDVALATIARYNARGGTTYKVVSGADGVRMRAAEFGLEVATEAPEAIAA